MLRACQTHVIIIIIFIKKPLYSSKDVAKSRPQDAFLPLSFTFPLGGISRWRGRKTLQQSPPPSCPHQKPLFFMRENGGKRKMSGKALDKQKSFLVSLACRARSPREFISVPFLEEKFGEFLVPPPFVSQRKPWATHPNDKTEKMDREGGGGRGRFFFPHLFFPSSLMHFFPSFK